MSNEVIAERVSIPGPSGRLTGELAYPMASAPRCACLIVNPHPYMGGRMGNNIIARLAAGLPETGTITLRFDYAGIGESDTDPARPIDVARSMSVFWETGHAPEDPGWIEDARAAFNWLDREVDVPIAVVGYSFGAHVAAAVVTGVVNERVHALALISPTLARHDLASVRDVPCPKLIVYSDNDFATPAGVTERWAASLRRPVQTVRLNNAEHFFRGVEDRVVELVRDFLRRQAPGEGVAA